MCASVLLLSETRSRGRNGGECMGGRGKEAGMAVMMMVRLKGRNEGLDYDDTNASVALSAL